MKLKRIFKVSSVVWCSILLCYILYGLFLLIALHHGRACTHKTLGDIFLFKKLNLLANYTD